MALPLWDTGPTHHEFSPHCQKNLFSSSFTPGILDYVNMQLRSCHSLDQNTPMPSQPRAKIKSLPLISQVPHGLAYVLIAQIYHPPVSYISSCLNGFLLLIKVFLPQGFCSYTLVWDSFPSRIEMTHLLLLKAVAYMSSSCERSFLTTSHA